jgi:hypothetical protein
VARERRLKWTGPFYLSGALSGALLGFVAQQHSLPSALLSSSWSRLEFLAAVEGPRGTRLEAWDKRGDICPT